MRAKLKPLAGQVIIVTGAVSGIGLETARNAAKAGAAVVLAATDETAVRQLCQEITTAGGRCHPVVGDLRTVEGCERIARAAAARFGHVDSWIAADSDDAGLANAARALVRHIVDRNGAGALVGFGRRVGRAARTELRQAHGRVAATLIRTPTSRRGDAAAAQAALHAVTRPMGRMTVAENGKRLTTITEVKKRPGLVAATGLLALAGVAVWLGRGRIAQVAAAARPRLARAARPLVAEAVRRRPALVARLAAIRPHQAAKSDRALG